MTVSSVLLLATALFAVGVYGLLTRRQVIAILLSVELMANAANLAMVAFGRPVIAVFSLALTVAEVAVGLAIVLILYRARGDTAVDAASEMKG
jgi:NADH-quinone oxidoreductase subunit K